MATLELQVNCLCLFVTDSANKVVHILMPGTKGHGGNDGHDGHAENHAHCGRMMQRGFAGETAKSVGLGMEGWALALGPANASADTTLAPRDAASKGQLPNLTELAGGDKKVDAALVGLEPGDRVAARITLRSGWVTRLDSEATWEIAGQSFALAHQVTWWMPDVDGLEWKGHQIGRAHV